MIHSASIRSMRGNDGRKGWGYVYTKKYKFIFLCIYAYSPHPYIFFNQDGVTITFVGFTVTENGDLINPVDKKQIECSIMTKRLYLGLQSNGVNFKDDYQHWKKQVMIEKICTVMGVENSAERDPDKSYVLTVDNVIKILAIQMRFR